MAVPKGPVFVTGGSSGIGYALAAELLRYDIPIVLFARDRKRLEEARDGLRQERDAFEGSGETVVHIEVADVSDRTGLAAAFARAAELTGPPETVIHAAGVADPDYFQALTDDRFRRQLEINLVGSWNVFQEGVALLQRRTPEPGYLLAVSSLAGLIPTFGYTAYGATKFGLTGLALTLRQELYRQGIFVSVLAPGDMDTPGLLTESATKPPETRALAGSRPLDPRLVARYAVKRLYRRKATIIPMLLARLQLFLYRIAPSLGERIMRTMIEGVSRAR